MNLRFVPLADSPTDIVRARVLRDMTSAELSPFLATDFPRDEFEDAIRQTDGVTAWAGDVCVGHLCASFLSNDVFGNGAWVSPDGVSFDSLDVLAAMYAHMGSKWREADVREHFVWTHHVPNRIAAWQELGFHLMHRRGSLRLDSVSLGDTTPEFTLRRGTASDIDDVLRLSSDLHHAQSLGPSFSFDLEFADERTSWLDELAEPDGELWFLEKDDGPLAQFLIYPLPPRRDAPSAVMHLSAVSVSPSWRGQGLGQQLVDAAVRRSRERGCSQLETNWRVSHRGAARFWERYGFTPTATRLHRTVGTY